jgi:hypothetical protein
VDRSVATTWLEVVRSALGAEAETHAIDLRQLAATLLIAVVGDDRSIFVQIGDGALVTSCSTSEADVAEAVFWPQNGEYANTTYFVTDRDVGELALFEAREKPYDGVAAFTDGVQALALDYHARAPHRPFFEAFFKKLRESSEPDDLCVPFRQFLNSKQVNERTDDDKTLVIAVREAESAR